MGFPYSNLFCGLGEEGNFLAITPQDAAQFLDLGIEEVEILLMADRERCHEAGRSSTVSVCLTGMR